jgi:hypothetical protein
MNPSSQEFASYNSTPNKFSTSSNSSLRMVFRKGDKNAIKEFYSGKDHKLSGIFFNGIGYLSRFTNNGCSPGSYSPATRRSTRWILGVE